MQTLPNLELLWPANGRDPITGLPGHGDLLERLNSIPPGAEIALLCIGLNYLSSLNESSELAGRNDILVEVAKRIATSVSGNMFSARLGDNEFAVLIENVSDLMQVDSIASRLSRALRSPHVVIGREVPVAVNIGISCTLMATSSAANLPHTTIAQAFVHAKAALGRAKAAAKDSWLMYEAEPTPELGSRRYLEWELSNAVEQQQFLVYYQPKASCRSGKVTGFEALVRWLHPVRGLIQPSEFIPILESTGLIDRMGAWVLKAACQQLIAWDVLGYDKLTMAVNVSLHQLADLKYPESVQQILAELGVPAERLELELTESLLMQDVQQTEATLFRLKTIGVRLSIDDFGTGYSSLAYLKRLPIDTVKIDRTFVEDITTNPNDASITRAIIGMARSLNLLIVAEGVETEAQLSKLASEHCDTVQGYLIGKPMSAADATAYLASGYCLPSELIGRPAKSRTLLLVDDEESIISALRRLLRRDGYRILSADSGSEGLELLAKNDVDVIVSDQRMPNMTGEEFLRLAKELYPDTVRMVLSGYADMQSITNAINQGAIYKFLSKPWDDKGLKDSILEAFRRKELSDENARLTREIGSMNEDLNRSNKALESLLGEQSRKSLMGQAALSTAQQTLHLLPIPVVGLDCEGMVVLRNEAFAELGLDEDIVPMLSAKLSQLPPSGVVYFDELELRGRRWTVAGRRLPGGVQTAGVVFAFIQRSQA